MSKIIRLILAVSFLFAVSNVVARETLHEYSIADVMEKSDNANRLKSVLFYFGEQNHSLIKETHGEFSTNKKTNAFGKVTLKHVSGS